MKKILLVCAAGMSTSMLVKRMQDHAKSIGLEVDIEALSISDAKDKVGSIDIVMLGPQVRYQKAEVEEVVNGRIPVLVIDMKDYGSMNGKAVLETALAAIQ
ncbi:PTS sugar transporter subunit IIB [Yersinia kristensenii]|uniref:PTS sugar transporter subunit IIB n=1 Tax=Yersinia kristensenii TaxID=28152 RepID=A0A0T9LQZ4_YERKR|nr:PTS sugar transporter subunit IIB [Yersinia kristensenii]MBW5814122.1 PTS sugar transporter subunit IIB [Yersinia kristensenii]MBW5815643.1 PTS sugar transporter subunit IIB [Yersinia kristensenii]MBW5826910.1 PTS sugar transporter subunit IIB [Yersinia kristensenii]MBW5831310.1 PTS sugar transporter subunit IIB [Yersinia kristensenii]MBW5843788.1 PTS sugar transporter subunit IIB [Yersinia kristensenii]